MLPAIVVIGPPKSASTYVCSALSETLRIPRVQPESRGILYHQIQSKEPYDGLRSDVVVYPHARATEYNLNLLHYRGVRRFVLLVRDPRDSIVPWFHHQERYNEPWHVAMGASAGLHSISYPELDRRGKLEELIELGFPQFQDWLRLWAQVVDADDRFTIHVERYEDFVTNSVSELQAILSFFGRTTAPVPPEIKSAALGEDGNMTFRRGLAGAYRDELAADQIARLNQPADTELYRRFGWII